MVCKRWSLNRAFEIEGGSKLRLEYYLKAIKDGVKGRFQSMVRNLSGETVNNAKPLLNTLQSRLSRIRSQTLIWLKRLLCQQQVHRHVQSEWGSEQFFTATATSLHPNGTPPDNCATALLPYRGAMN